MTTEDKVFTLDIPQEDGVKGFTGTFFAMYLKLADILKSPDFSKNPMNVYLMANLIISLIPTDNINGKDLREEIRKTLKQKRKTLEDEFRKEHKLNGDVSLSQSQSDFLLLSASVETLGNVTDYIDKFVGLSHKNKIGFSRKKSSFVSIDDPNKLKYTDEDEVKIEKNFANDETKITEEL